MEVREFLTMGEMHLFFEAFITYATEIHDIHDIRVKSKTCKADILDDVAKAKTIVTFSVGSLFHN